MSSSPLRKTNSAPPNPLAHGRPQAWARGALAPQPSGNVVKCFCALVVIAKRSVDELFMHYFHNLSSASGDSAPIPLLGLHPWTPLEGFRSQTPSLPTPGKNPAGAHALACFEVTSRREKRGEKERKEMD